MSAGIIVLPNKNLMSSQTFTSSGTFNVPDDVDHIFVEAWGGGGGGGNGGANEGTGGCGGSYGFRGLSVTAGGTVSVTIGAGGGSQADGGNTTVGSLVFKGGLRGYNTGTTSSYVTIAGQALGGGFPNVSGLIDGNQGQDSFMANGGAEDGGSSAGGGGAGRGNGAAGGGTTGNNASSNSAAGGGGGGTNVGGSGGSGHAIIYWVKP